MQFLKKVECHICIYTYDTYIWHIYVVIHMRLYDYIYMCMSYMYIQRIYIQIYVCFSIYCVCTMNVFRKEGEWNQEWELDCQRFFCISWYSNMTFLWLFKTQIFLKTLLEDSWAVYWRKNKPWCNMLIGVSGMLFTALWF